MSLFIQFAWGPMPQSPVALCTSRRSGFAVLHRKRRAAAARALRMRVLEHEPAAEQGRVVVERRAVEQPMAARVDPDAHAVRSFEDEIGVARRRFPREDVLESRAAARLDADAKARGVGVLLLDQLLNLRSRRFR